MTRRLASALLRHHGLEGLVSCGAHEAAARLPVAQRPGVEELGRHFEAASSSTSRHAHSREYTAANLVNLLRLQTRFVPVLCKQAHASQKRLQTDVGLGVNHLRSL